MLKRADEKWVTERAYENPKFVEDLVRDVALRLNADARVGRYSVDVENFESIHATRPSRASSAASPSTVQAEQPRVAAALAHQHRRVAGQVDHRGRLHRAGAGIDHRLHQLLEAVADLVRVVHRLGLAGRDQRGGEQRLAELFEQRLRHRDGRARAGRWCGARGATAGAALPWSLPG